MTIGKILFSEHKIVFLLSWNFLVYMTSAYLFSTSSVTPCYLASTIGLDYQ